MRIRGRTKGKIKEGDNGRVMEMFTEKGKGR